MVHRIGYQEGVVQMIKKVSREHEGYEVFKAYVGGHKDSRRGPWDRSKTGFEGSVLSPLKLPESTIV